MKHIRTFWPPFLVVALTTLSGVVSGALSNRWGPPAGAKLSAARLAEIPKEFGDWQMQADLPVEPGVIEMLQCVGDLHRLYRNRETGQLVNIVIFLGPPGPISAHTPEVCYSRQDFDQLGSPRRDHILRGESDGVRVAGPTHTDATVWRMKFRSNTLRGELLSVAYTWNCGEGWTAADSPRISFAGQPLLYKLQLSTRIDTELSDDAGDPCESFLKAFLPVCNATLFTN